MDVFGRRGADVNTSSPVAADAHAVTIGEMRVQTVPELPYLHLSAETTFAKMAEPVKQGFDKIFASAVEARIFFARPTMLVYQGSPHASPDKAFQMEIGVIVGPDTATPADLKVRKTAAFKCASVLYTGPVNQQGEAWQKLIPAAKAAGHTPTGEERELCLYWEGFDSPNNVFLMQLGIK